MFTGIIEAVGSVKSIDKKGASGRIKVDARVDLTGVVIGDSIAVSGACLTVVGVTRTGFDADVSAETLKATTLGALLPGSSVNIERALTLSKPLGGHLVTGHVDGTGVILGAVRKDAYVDIEIGCPVQLLAQIVKKGSVAIDGVSLTVAHMRSGGFSVAIIPHTAAKTTLNTLTPGARVNIETDIIGKYVMRCLAKGQGDGITEGFLAEHGFLKSQGA